MIIDSSALVAILRTEPETNRFLRAIYAAASRSISAANYLEVGIVIDGVRDPTLSRRVDELLTAMHIRIEPVTEAQARIAREAYRDFGRGSGHAANLNFGDCLAYALAKDLDEPLLFKGNDFTHTDVKNALAR